MLYGVYLASSEIIDNMLQLKRLGLYLDGILNRKWLLSYRNNDVSYREAKGLGAYATRENLEMIDAIWHVLMYYFDQIIFKKVPLFIIKISIIATHLATLFLLVIFLLE